MVAGVVALLAASQITFAANRAPTTYGEIYTVAPNGHVTNLSRSPAADTYPQVSPNGRLVAFARERATSVQVYVVGTDGHGLHAVSPRLPGGGLHDAGVQSIAWAPDSRRLAVTRATSVNSSTLYTTSTSGGWRVLERQVDFAPAVWSHDGRRIAVMTVYGFVDVLDAAGGRRLWRAAGEGRPAWSPRGLLAVQGNSHTTSVYDAAGRERGTFHAGAFAWRGERLASVRGGVLEIRENGVGTPTTSARVLPKRPGNDSDVEWIGPNRLRVLGADLLWRGYDLRRHRAWTLPAAARPFDSVVSARGLAAYERYGRQSSMLVRGRVVVKYAPSCSDEPQFEQLQFVGETNALVYQSGCVLPSSDIYSLAADGSVLTQVTDTPFDEFAPALRPDGAAIAYSRQEFAERCKGCPHELWTTPGSQLTKHAYDDEAPFDDEPSFSPDGTQVAFVRSGPDSRPTLFTVPAAGGSAKSLGIVADHAAWGTSGVAYATGYNPATIGLVDPSSGTRKTLATIKGLEIAAFAWSTDGRLAYLGDNGAGRATIGIVGGKQFKLAQRGVTGLAWSPDGSRFAFVAQDAFGWGEVWTIAVAGGAARQVTHDLGVSGNLSWR